MQMFFQKIKDTLRQNLCEIGIIIIDKNFKVIVIYCFLIPFCFLRYNVKDFKLICILSQIGQRFNNQDCFNLNVIRVKQQA